VFFLRYDLCFYIPEDGMLIFTALKASAFIQYLICFSYREFMTAQLYGAVSESVRISTYIHRYVFVRLTDNVTFQNIDLSCSESLYITDRLEENATGNQLLERNSP
jgi:hypothetical protein